VEGFQKNVLAHKKINSWGGGTPGKAVATGSFTTKGNSLTIAEGTGHVQRNQPAPETQKGPLKKLGVGQVRVGLWKKGKQRTLLTRRRERDLCVNRRVDSPSKGPPKSRRELALEETACAKLPTGPKRAHRKEGRTRQPGSLFFGK